MRRLDRTLGVTPTQVDLIERLRDYRADDGRILTAIALTTEAADAIATQAAENERLRELLDRAAKSLERNLYRQTEKLEWIAPAFRAALSAQPSEHEGGA